MPTSNVHGAPGTVLDPGDKAVSNTDKTPRPPEAYILVTSLPPLLPPQFL